jgi:hypothetical protein
MPTFRARARAVDLLGKGQIADLPTAICELWKNGYDAYADNLDCHLYLKGYKGVKNPLLVLSDENRIEISDDSTTRYLRSSLSGLYNGFRENKEIGTHFWLHENKGKYDLIASENFFLEEDIRNADHWLEGAFAI